MFAPTNPRHTMSNPLQLAVFLIVTFAAGCVTNHRDGGAEPVRATGPATTQVTDNPFLRWPIELPKTARMREAAATFSYPPEFVERQYEADVLSDMAGVKRTMKNGIALAEPRLLDGSNAQRVPLSTPSIGITLSREDYKLFFAPNVDPKWKIQLGTRDAIKLPGFPAPSGENVCCYLMPRTDGTVVLFIGVRTFGAVGGDRPQPTHYDWAIERIIATWQDEK